MVKPTPPSIFNLLFFGDTEVSIDLLYPVCTKKDNEYTRKLREDIVQNGLRERLSVIHHVHSVKRKKTPFQITDGNHRYWILKELGVSTVKITVKPDV